VYALNKILSTPKANVPPVYLDAQYVLQTQLAVHV
jgi:hypothetical protein